MVRSRPPPPEAPERAIRARKHGITRQHEKIASLCLELHMHLEEADASDCLDLGSRLQLALDSHFTVEETVVFPTLRSNHPELVARIDAIELEHATLRRELDQLIFCIGATSRSQAVAVLHRLRGLLDGHELQEERCLAEDAES